MTEAQGWLMLVLMGLIGAFLVYQHDTKGPSDSQKAMIEQYRQSCAVLNTNCAQYKRLKEKFE